MTDPPRRGALARVLAALLAPGTTLLGRLRYGKKFAFIGLVLLVPLGYTTSAYVHVQDREVAFSAKERVGVAYLRPLLALLGTEVEQDRYPFPVAWRRAVARVDEADAAHGAALGIRDRWAASRALLVEADRNDDPEVRVEARDALLQLIVDLGDASNLTLDRDLDTYYLVNALQSRLPAMLVGSSRLGGARASAAPGTGDQQLDTGEQIGALESDLESLSRGFATTVRTTRSAVLVRRLPEAEYRLRQATLDLRAQVVGGGDATPSRTRLSAASAVQRQVVQLMDLTAPQLDRLLLVRIERFEAIAHRVRMIAMLSALLAAYLFVAFYRSVGSPVRALVAALRAVGAGDLTQTVRVDTRDELHQIAEAINHTVALTKQATDRLEQQATHDPLTGLANRVLVLDRLRHALARVDRHRTHVALLFIDLDRFKLVNDLRGHKSGDAVLRTVAERLRGVVSPGDTVGRLAGDEFVVVCEDLPEPGAALALARAVTAALRHPIATPDRADTTIGASVGIAFAQPGSVLDADGLLRDADAAMYRAKDQGGGRVEIFDEALRAAVASREALQAELLQALRRDELVLHYQPIVDTHSLRTTGWEALVRWQHPRRGLLGPGEFVPLAEETGNVVPLGAWVLRAACRQLSAWVAEAPELAGMTMSVNLSVHELADPALLVRVQETLAETGVEPAWLCLELTESAVMVEPGSARQTLLDLSALGVTLAIDDFGQGQSSLSYIRNLPVQRIKIDRSFIAALDGSRANEALVGLVADLGEALGLDVVAEGIETDGQLDDVRRLGCGRVQGYMLGKPVAAQAARAALDLRAAASAV